MKKIIFLFLAFLSVAATAHAFGTFQENDAFRTARAVKLGRQSEAEASRAVKGGFSSGKETYECFSDGDCGSAEKCANNKCIDACSLISCTGETPSCAASGHTASCRCTSSSCGEGKQCGGTTCSNCSPGSYCGCPNATPYADGNGGCAACTADSHCDPGMKCSGGQCSACTGAEQCGCPTNETPDGDGGCRTACTVGQTNCSLCTSGQVWDGTKCRMPCDGMQCPSATHCVNGTGKGCCVSDPVYSCSAGCTNCDTSTGTCRGCAEGSYLSGGSCSLCPTGCSSCTSASNCTACAAKYELSGGRCSYNACAGVNCSPGETCRNGMCGTMCLGRGCTSASFCNSASSVCTSDGCCIKGYTNASSQCFMCHTAPLEKTEDGSCSGGTYCECTHKTTTYAHSAHLCATY